MSFVLIRDLGAIAALVTFVCMFCGLCWIIGQSPTGPSISSVLWTLLRGPRDARLEIERCHEEIKRLYRLHGQERRLADRLLVEHNLFAQQHAKEKPTATECPRCVAIAALRECRLLESRHEAVPEDFERTRH